MNPVLVVRALGALALPMIVVIGALDRRRSKNDEGEAGEPFGEPLPDLLPRPSRRQLRALVKEGGDLRRHDLRRADLRGIPLEGADLSGLDLRHSRLRGCVLRGTNLSYTRLDYADLSGCVLSGADLTGASLLETDLGSADLRGLDLRGARQLAMANLRHVVTDRTTRYPDGFRPVTSGPI